MRNPFRYGGVVSEDAFCNREKELKDLLRAMDNAEKFFVHSERRLGKTSLIKLALKRLPKKEYLGVYVDLWPTDSALSFATATAKAITEALGSTADKALEVAKKFFGRLTPSATLDNEGKLQVSFGLQKMDDPGPELEEVLGVPARIAAQGKKKVVVVFDEFQQVLEYGSDLTERRLRSVIQMHEQVAYIFLGSRKHLIQKMFLDKSRPLYRAGGHYPLGPIAEAHWQPFIHERFFKANKQIAAAHIHSICHLTEGNPFYTQHLCHVLWELCEVNAQVTEALLESAIQVLLERESYTYTTLWESFTINQRRFLSGLADAPSDVKPFSADFIQRYRLGTASNAQRAAKTLLERDVIDRDDGSFVLSDRFFRIWIQKMQG